MHPSIKADMTGDVARLPVSVVSVCYNSAAVVPAMLDSLPAGLQVILVDNGSADATLLEKIAAERNAKLILNPENRGFGTACNQGATLADTQFMLFLNPDAALEPGALEELLAAAMRYPQASAMNPAIVGNDGRPSFKRSSVLLPRAKWMKRGWPESDCEVPVLNGAALFIRRASFEKAGGFDTAICLYHEDDDLSLRLRAKCGPLMFVRAAVVRHRGGRSSPRSREVAALKGWHMGRSRVYTARKHGLTLPFARALVSALLQVLSPINVFSARKRAKQWSFLRGVWSARNVTMTE